MTREDDDIDWDEWMSLSEAEMDQRLEAAMKDYVEWWETLSSKEQIAISRKNALENCLRWRRLISQHGFDFLSDNLKRSQARLLAIREWRRTGQQPGHA